MHTYVEAFHLMGKVYLEIVAGNNVVYWDGGQKQTTRVGRIRKRCIFGDEQGLLS